MFIIFLWIGTTLAFLHSDGKHSPFNDARKTYPKGLWMDSPHIFSMQILIISCLRALLGSKPLIILPMPLLLNTEWDIFLGMIDKVRRKLTAIIRYRTLLRKKKRVEKFRFSLKSVINLLSWNNSGIHGIFFFFYTSS